jgi:hypothetical protein
MYNIDDFMRSHYGSTDATHKPPPLLFYHTFNPLPDGPRSYMT